jgi:predicted permease
MDTLLQDLRYAVRTLAKNPGFAVAAWLTLALGIGANGAIFNLTNAMLLKPLPGVEPQALARLTRQSPEGRTSRTHSYLAYREFAAEPELGELAATTLVTAAWTRSGTVDQLLAEVVSDNYFQWLGIGAAHGRVLAPLPDTAGERVAVISHALWRNKLESRPDAVGAALVLNGEPFTVIGVAPEHFNGLQAGLLTDLWVPLEQAPGWIGPRGWMEDVTSNRLDLLLRRAKGRSIAQTQAVADGLAAGFVQRHPEASRDQRLRVAPARLLDGSLRTGVAAFLAVLMGIVGLVLLTACANLTNLLLVRAAGRRREFAVRMALGASRVRLLQQLLSESLVLGVLAGGLAVLISSWASNLLTRFNPLPSTIPIAFDMRMDARVYLFIAALSLGMGLVLGLLPALHASRASALDGLRDATRSAGAGTASRSRQVFVAAQVALSLAVLVLAGLFLRSLQNAARMDLGFEPRRAVALDVDVRTKGWSDERANEYYREIRRRIEGLPGVQAVAFANLMPLDLATGRTPVVIAGHEPVEGREPLRLSFNRIDPGYFATLGIPLRGGRDFTERDDEHGMPAVVINETMARRYWPGGEAIGKSFRLEGADAGPIERSVAASVVQVVGVVADAKYRTLGETPEPHFYLPYGQSFDGARSVIARTTGDPGPLLAAVQHELLAVDPALPGFFARTLEQQISLAFLPARLAGIVSAAFGLLALALATVGIYGVVAYSVAQRTREMGIRLALGATPGDVLRLVLGQGMRLVALGIVIGAAGALGLAQLVGGFLYDVHAADPGSYLAATALLTAMAIVSCYLPARRATRVDPMAALRHE